MENKRRNSIINAVLIIMLVVCVAIGALLILLSKAKTDSIAKSVDEIKNNYTTTEETTSTKTWDVSEDGDGSVTATLSEDGTLTISGTGNMKNWNYGDETEWHKNYQNYNIKDIIISEGVTSIGNNAFYLCTSLTSIKIPEGVTSIGNSAFCWCTNLTSVEIPNSLTSIENDVFCGCESLTSINIPTSIKTIGSSAFSGCSSLISIEIPNSVTSIGGGAFESCSSLTNIKIPEGLTKIEYSTFLGCSSLTNIEIPEEVITIESNAFSGCSNLTNIEIPEGVTGIGSRAFAECSNLTSIKIPSKVKSIEGSVFSGCSSLISIDLPEEIRGIYNYAFKNCSSLISIHIPSSVTTIYDGAFYGCSNLASVEMSENVWSIGNYAFYNCSNLTSIELSEGLRSIGEHAFDGCSKFTNIEIPSSVTSIGVFAFAWCSNLTGIEVNENNVNYMDDNGVLYTKDKTKIIKYPEAKSESEYAILNGTENIGIYAFCACDNLTRIYIPESVTSIKETAFYQCSNFTIICKSGTTAETYAKENNISCQTDDVAPIITSINSQATEDTITINTEATDENVGVAESSYKYYIKEDNGEYGIAKEGEATYTITELKSNTKYIIKVEALDKVGNVSSQEVEVTTLESNKITSTEYTVDEENLMITEINPKTTIAEIKTSLQSNISYEIQDQDGNTVSEDAKIGTGYKIKMENNNTYTLIVKGDSTGDGEADIKDIFAINKYRLNGTGLDAEYVQAADVNGDGRAEIKDIFQINKYRVGIISEL